MDRFIALVAFLVFTVAALVGAEADRYKTTFLVLTEAVDTHSAQQIQGLVGDFIQASLESEGIPVMTLPEEISVASAYDENEPKLLLLEYLADLGDTADADFVIFCLIDDSTGGITLQFRWVSTDEAALIASVDERVAQLLVLDLAIVGAVQKLLDQSRDRLVPAPETVDEAPDLDLPPPPIVRMQEPERPSNFLLSAGVGILQVVGESAALFSEGLSAAIRASYGLPTANGAITLGLAGGVATIAASGVAGAVANILAPVGLQAGIAVWPSGFLEVEVAISGGLAFLGVDVDQNGYLFKVVPQALAVIGLSLFPGSHVGLGIGLSVVAYFEETLPIFGYVPAAGIVFR